MNETLIARRLKSDGHSPEEINDYLDEIADRERLDRQDAERDADTPESKRPA